MGSEMSSRTSLIRCINAPRSLNCPDDPRAAHLPAGVLWQSYIRRQWPARQTCLLGSATDGRRRVSPVNSRQSKPAAFPSAHEIHRPHSEAARGARRLQPRSPSVPAHSPLQEPASHSQIHSGADADHETEQPSRGRRAHSTHTLAPCSASPPIETIAPLGSLPETPPFPALPIRQRLRQATHRSGASLCASIPASYRPTEFPAPIALQAEQAPERAAL